MRASDVDAEIDDAAQLAARHREFIQRETACDLSLAAPQLNMQARALLAHHIARKRSRDNGNHAIFGRIHEEAQVAEIDAQNRHAMLAHKTGGAKHGSVTAKRNHHVERLHIDVVAHIDDRLNGKRHGIEFGVPNSLRLQIRRKHHRRVDGLGVGVVADNQDVHGASFHDLYRSRYDCG